MKLFKLISFILLHFVLFSCNTNVIDETAMSDDKTELMTISGTISPSLKENFDDCVVTTISGTSNILNNQFAIKSSINKCVQTFFVNDGNNVYLIGRTAINDKSEVTIDESTTAIALVTMHPLFSPVEIRDYKELEFLIRSSSKY